MCIETETVQEVSDRIAAVDVPLGEAAARRSTRTRQIGAKPSLSESATTANRPWRRACSPRILQSVQSAATGGHLRLAGSATGTGNEIAIVTASAIVIVSETEIGTATVIANVIGIGIEIESGTESGTATGITTVLVPAAMTTSTTARGETGRKSASEFTAAALIVRMMISPTATTVRQVLGAAEPTTTTILIAATLETQR